MGIRTDNTSGGFFTDLVTAAEGAIETVTARPPKKAQAPASNPLVMPDEPAKLGDDAPATLPKGGATKTPDPAKVALVGKGEATMNDAIGQLMASPHRDDPRVQECVGDILEAHANLLANPTPPMLSHLQQLCGNAGELVEFLDRPTERQSRRQTQVENMMQRAFESYSAAIDKLPKGSPESKEIEQQYRHLLDAQQVFNNANKVTGDADQDQTAFGAMHEIDQGKGTLAILAQRAIDKQP